MTEQLKDLPVDSGMSGEAVERAEWAWANLPVGPRKWTSLTTAEKALVCHVIARFTPTDDRASIFEECARVADAVAARPANGSYELAAQSEAAEEIATAIRNLAPNPSPEPSHDN
jgi:hypothetical protein